MPVFDELNNEIRAGQFYTTNKWWYGNQLGNFITNSDAYITKEDLRHELDKFGRKLLRILDEMKYYSVDIPEDEIMYLLLGEDTNEDH